MRADGSAIKLAPTRFGFPPTHPKGRAGLQFPVGGPPFRRQQPLPRPRDRLLQFTGKKYPKAKHSFSLRNAPFLAIAGLWREGQNNQPPSSTMLTTEPGPDVEPYHNRQVAVLRPQDWSSWIYLTTLEADLLKPLPAQSLKVETVRAESD